VKRFLDKEKIPAVIKGSHISGSMKEAGLDETKSKAGSTPEKKRIEAKALKKEENLNSTDQFNAPKKAGRKREAAEVTEKREQGKRQKLDID
jgi:hypothetical protein